MASARRLSEGIVGSRFAEIPSGHPVVFERPRELVEELRRFLFSP